MKSLQEKGKDPQALRDKPDLPLHLNEYIYAFNILNLSRSENQSIHLSELVCYKNEFGTPNGTRIFIEILQAVDLSFLEYTNKNDRRINESIRIN